MRLSKRQVSALKAMGIPAWQERVPADFPKAQDQAPSEQLISGNEEVSETSVPEAEPPLPVQDTSTWDWSTLEAAVMDCQQCALHEGRSQTVFGTGNQQADWMLIGEAPGAEEDKQGLPFVGRAGQLLDRMLAAIGLQREQVYIANIVKCRPPGNRDPKPEEAAACSAYLKRQIELVNPKVILVLGKVAAHHLLGTEEALGKLRGAPYLYADTGIPVIVTYHPAYLLRKPSEKRKSWEDLKLAVKLTGGSL
jgi:DNA polymerase